MMAGPPVSIGAAVVVSPGVAGPPDSGFILVIPQVSVVAGGMPLAVAGSICQMINSVSGVPYPLVLGSVGVSTSLTVSGQGLVRVGDQIPSASGVVTVIGPSAAPWMTDGGPP